MTDNEPLIFIARIDGDEYSVTIFDANGYHNFTINLGVGA